MAKLDEKLTVRMQLWLNTDHSTADMICQGAEMLLSLNRNQILYSNVVRNPLRPQWKEKLEYELAKYLKIRLANMTRTEVAQMDVRVTKEAENIIEQGTVSNIDTDKEAVSLKGRRKDHDSLPVDVQHLFNSCSGIYKKIRKLHTLLRSMNNLPSCDRYEYLKQMDELDDIYRKRMKEYDEYEFPKSGNSVVVEESHETPEESLETREESHETTDEMDELPEESPESADKNGISNPIAVARTWLNRNKKRLEKMAEKKDFDSVVAQKYEDLLFEFRPRIDDILNNGGTIGAKLRMQLRNLGVKFPDEQNA